MFFPVPTLPQAHTANVEKAPPTRASSLSTRTEISLKSTLLQVREGGTPSVQAAAPPLWHSINWDSGSLLPSFSLPEGALPPQQQGPQSLLLAVPALDSLACLDSPLPGPSVPSRAPSIHHPVLDSMAAQQLERMRRSLCAFPSRVSGGWLLCGHSPSHLHVVH